MMIYYIVLLVMTMFGSVASLFLKKASGSNSPIDMLKKILDYSVILPLTSLTYIWTMVLSYFILKERITVKKIAGVCLILVGAIIISIL